MVSEVRMSDEGNERSLRTMEELRTNKELIDNEEVLTYVVSSFKRHEQLA